MATLAESFLEDLADLSDGSESESGSEGELGAGDTVSNFSSHFSCPLLILLLSKQLQDSLYTYMIVPPLLHQMGEDAPDEPVRFDNLAEVCTLSASDKYTSVMQRVRGALEGEGGSDQQPVVWTGEPLTSSGRTNR